MSSSPLLARLAAEPTRAALLLDVDGTLAPIVDVPADAAVPEETRIELRRLHGRYGLVACVSGRPSADAERIVGVPELVYVGEHGLELSPDAPAWRERLHRFAATVDWNDVELKPLTVSFHYRRAPDEDDARRTLDAVATRLTEDQLIRQVLQGRGNMPAYGKNLSPAQTTALVAFLKTLRPAGQAPAQNASLVSVAPTAQGEIEETKR